MKLKQSLYEDVFVGRMDMYEDMYKTFNPNHTKKDLKRFRNMLMKDFEVFNKNCSNFDGFLENVKSRI